eukprot:TRINITY_DN9330_c0_g1_i1.p1 TRINITY_DN9330_c0_g1~~TRINITY_DN9330_c0_g1_i1.p1  ORF type:complete len:1089 (+),score=446.42 TRINITY_DN9330_c0_g1_i1:51-3269(+)
MPVSPSVGRRRMPPSHGGVDSPSVEQYRRGAAGADSRGYDAVSARRQQQKHAAAVAESRAFNGGRDHSLSVGRSVGIASVLCDPRCESRGGRLPELKRQPAIAEVTKPARSAHGSAKNAVRALEGSAEGAAATRIQSLWRGYTGRRAAAAERRRADGGRRRAVAAGERVRRVEAAESEDRARTAVLQRGLFTAARLAEQAGRSAAAEAQRRREQSAAAAALSLLRSCVTAQRLFRGRLGRRAAAAERRGRAHRSEQRRAAAVAAVTWAEALQRAQTAERQQRVRVALSEGCCRAASLARLPQPAAGAHSRTLGSAATAIQKQWRGHRARRWTAARRRLLLIAAVLASRTELHEEHHRAVLQLQSGVSAEALRQHAAAERRRAWVAARVRCAAWAVAAEEQRRRCLADQDERRTRVSLAQLMSRESLCRRAAARRAALLPEQLLHTGRLRKGAAGMQRLWRGHAARRRAEQLRRLRSAEGDARRTAALLAFRRDEALKRAVGVIEPQNRRRLAIRQLAARSKLVARIQATAAAVASRLRRDEAARAALSRARHDAAARVQRLVRRFVARVRGERRLRQRRAERVWAVLAAEAEGRVAHSERQSRRWLGLCRSVAWVAAAPRTRAVLARLETATRAQLLQCNAAERMQVAETRARGLVEGAAWAGPWTGGIRQRQRIARLAILSDEALQSALAAAPAAAREEPLLRQLLERERRAAADVLQRRSLSLSEAHLRSVLRRAEAAAAARALSAMLAAAYSDAARGTAALELAGRDAIAELCAAAEDVARQAERTRVRAEEAEQRWRREEEERLHALAEQEARAAKAELAAAQAAEAAAHAERLRLQQQEEERRRVKEQIERAKAAAALAERARRAAEEATRAQQEADALMVKVAVEEQTKARTAQKAADAAQAAADDARKARERVERQKKRVADERAARVQDAKLEAHQARREALDADWRRQSEHKPQLQHQFEEVQSLAADGDTHAVLRALPAGAWVEAYGLRRNTDLNRTRGQLVRRRGEDMLVSFQMPDGRSSIKVLHMDNVRPCLRPAADDAREVRSPPIPRTLPPVARTPAK